MHVLDANYILRYLLKDNEGMFIEAKAVIEQKYCLILNEVLAEVVYVLSGVYDVPKAVIVDTLSELLMLDNLSQHEDKKYMLNALQIYRFKNIDFVDCCLCALSNKYMIKTFDKKLQKCMKKVNQGSLS